MIRATVWMWDKSAAAPLTRKQIKPAAEGGRRMFVFFPLRCTFSPSESQVLISFFVFFSVYHDITDPLFWRYKKKQNCQGIFVLFDCFWTDDKVSCKHFLNRLSQENDLKKNLICTAFDSFWKIKQIYDGVCRFYEIMKWNENSWTLKCERNVPTKPFVFQRGAQTERHCRTLRQPSASRLAK